MIAAGMYCLIASGARADLVGTGCAALVVALHILNRRNFTIVAGGAFVLAGAAVFAPALFNTFAPSQIGGREFRLEDRTDIWSKQIESFRGSPWVGWGFEFGNPERGYGRAGGEGSYTDLLSAVGTLGAIPFFAGLALGVLRYHRFLRRSSAAFSVAREQGQAFVDGLSLAICILVTSIAEPTMATVGTPMAMFVWVTVSAATVAKPVRVYLTAVRASWIPGQSSAAFQPAR
jgi:O-antigen ligase